MPPDTSVPSLRLAIPLALRTGGMHPSRVAKGLLQRHRAQPPARLCRFVVGMYAEGQAQMLPEALRQSVRAALSGQVLHCCDDVADHVSRARRRRDAGVRASLAAVASGFTFSTAQLASILACLAYSHRNQVRSCHAHLPCARYCPPQLFLLRIAAQRPWMCMHA